MSGKIKIAVNWAAACGGCDVALLDAEARVLDLAEVADIVYWPVATDGKRADLAALPDGEVDIGVFNGAVRTSEQEEDAHVLRKKSKVLVALGSCACFGGIPGLANFSAKDEVMSVAYRTTPSTENEEDLRPLESTEVDGTTLTLPAFSERVRSLADIVPVDVFAPGCPPSAERIDDLIDAVLAYASDGSVPPKGTFLAGEKALCDECPRRESRTASRIPEIHRPQELVRDSGECFLEQGLICMGIATRSGCGGTCISAGMPCRGCFGPTPAALDPAAEMISAIGSLAGPGTENDAPAHEWKKTIRRIRDPGGTFYRFTLPASRLGGRVTEEVRK